MATLSESPEPQVESVQEIPAELVNKGGRPKGKKAKQGPKVRTTWENQQMLTLAAKNVPIHQIARAIELPLSTVKHRLKKFDAVLKEMENVDLYRNIKTDILSASELALLKSSLTPGKMKKASMLDGVKAFDIINKANRLENNLSTSNEAHQVLGKISVSLSTPLKTEEKK